MWRLFGSGFFIVACLLFAALSIPAQQSPPKIAIEQLGPKVGEKIPDFRLQGQAGKTWTRDLLMGKNGLMLVFFRSADW
jgi:hypothetical protein